MTVAKAVQLAQEIGGGAQGSGIAAEVTSGAQPGR
jgi:hypothetical protein